MLTKETLSSRVAAIWHDNSGGRGKGTQALAGSRYGGPVVNEEPFVPADLVARDWMIDSVAI